MSNTVINKAVQNLNAEAQARNEAAAQRLVLNILAEREAIAKESKAIEGWQVELKKLQEASVTDEKVLGVALPPEGQRNHSQKTIADVIEKMNKAAQDSVAAASGRLSRNIIDTQAGITARNKRIAEMLEDIAKLEAPAITPEAVAGN